MISRVRLKFPMKLSTLLKDIMVDRTVTILYVAICISLLFDGVDGRGPSKVDPNNLKFFIYDFPGESMGWIGDQKWLRTSVYYGGYGESKLSYCSHFTRCASHDD